MVAALRGALDGASNGLIVRPLSEYDNRRPGRPGILIGHTAIVHASLQPAVRALEDVIILRAL